MNKNNRYGFQHYFECVFLAPFWAIPAIWLTLLVAGAIASMISRNESGLAAGILGGFIVGVTAYFIGHLIAAIVFAIALPLFNQFKPTLSLRAFIICGALVGQSYTLALYLSAIIGPQNVLAALIVVIAASAIGALIGRQCFYYLIPDGKPHSLISANRNKPTDLSIYQGSIAPYQTQSSAGIAALSCIPTTFLLIFLKADWDALLADPDFPFYLLLYTLFAGYIIGILFVGIASTLWAAGSIILTVCPPKRDWIRFGVLAAMFSGSLFLMFSLIAIGDLSPYSDGDRNIHLLLPYGLPISIVAGLVFTRSIYFPE